MAQKYYNVAETAVILGISEDDVKQMQARRELHGYRDGIDWKFKVDDIDQLARDRAEQTPAGADQGDVLLSEVELGLSDPGASGTVIGMDNTGAERRRQRPATCRQQTATERQRHQSGRRTRRRPGLAGSSRPWKSWT